MKELAKQLARVLGPEAEVPLDRFGTRRLTHLASSTSRQLHISADFL